MQADEYQKEATRTLPNDSRKDLLINMCLGLSGETGEVIDIIKKTIYHGHKLSKKHLMEELGDVCWYITNLASLTGIDLENIFEYNIKKLEKRYPNGFSSERSINREID